MHSKLLSNGWIGLALLVACQEPSGVAAPPAHSTAGPLVSAETSAEPTAQTNNAAPVDVAVNEPAWRRAVRGERYKDAKRLIDELPDAEKNKPEMRYLRAKVASKVGDHAAVKTLLENVDLPMFADEIAKLRAEAALETGPYDDACTFYEKAGRPRDLVKAAQAANKGKDTKRALAFADKALKESQRLKRQGDERAAHGVRAQILVAQGKVDEAMTDLKWLAMNAPTSSDGRFARKTLDGHDKKLGDKDKRAIIDALIEAGAGKDAQEALDKWGKAFSKPELLHRRAEALFKARSYTKASEAFVAASKVSSGRTAEQLYYAARSFARSKKEEQAITMYRDVIKRFKKGLWAERASYQLAQLLQSQGKYEEASQAFTSYLAKFADATDRDDAEYALALSLLSAKDPAKARTVFSKLAGRAKRTEWGFLRELEGVAALRAGQKDDAKKLFLEVATEQPLTWGAAMARARLAQMSEPLPPLVTPGTARANPPLKLALPPKAAQLVALGLDAEAESNLAENEASASAPYTGRETEALCLMYGQLSRAKRRYKVGSAAVSFESLMRAPSEADRWSWECLYPAPYRDRVVELEKEHTLTPGLVHSLMRQESAFDPEIRSPVGAEGLMQLMPSTAEQAAKEAKLDFNADDVTTPETNLTIGAFYIAKMLRTFDGSLPLAVASYNAGPGAVSRWVETAKELEADLFVARIPYEETRNYVMRVMGNLSRYQWLAGGDTAVQSFALELPRAARATDADY
ncbi:MAG: transglycosylase SLT domain-containing protein [Polyangiaceae bacterium]|nr:transglycosylase SLT domain-containing protein [Polyangiaceae bacterium]